MIQLCSLEFESQIQDTGDINQYLADQRSVSVNVNRAEKHSAQRNDRPVSLQNRGWQATPGSKMRLKQNNQGLQRLINFTVAEILFQRKIFGQRRFKSLKH